MWKTEKSVKILGNLHREIVMRSGIDPKVDYAFKKLFGSEENKSILIDLLSAVLGEQVADAELLNPFNAKDFASDKETILDVKARLSDGRLVNVEMQMWADKFYSSRILHYWSEVHSGQLKEGDDYQVLRPTIGIHFVNGVLFPETDRFHLTFRPQCMEIPGLPLNDQMVIHLFQLPKFNPDGGKVRTAIERWCYFLRHGADLDRAVLPASLKTQSIENALEVLEVISLDEKDRMLYLARVRAQRDIASSRAEAEQLGEERGALAGRGVGRIQGLSESLVLGMEIKYGTQALPYIDEVKRIQKDAKLLELQRRLYTDITWPEFVAQLHRDE